MKISLIAVVIVMIFVGCDQKAKHLLCKPYDSVVPVYTVANENEQSMKHIRWIEDNWSTLWPIVKSKLEEIAHGYAYGIKELEPHMKNPDNELTIELLSEGDSDEGGNWAVTLKIKKPHGYHAFYVELKDDEIVHAQTIY